MVLLAAGACAKAEDTADSGAPPEAPKSTYEIPAEDLVDKTGEATVTVTMVDNMYEPRYLKVSAGTQVVFRNDGRNLHDVKPEFDGAFAGSPDNLSPGGSYLVTFDEAGEFPYYCEPHGTMRNGMNGAIVVVDA